MIPKDGYFPDVVGGQSCQREPRCFTLVPDITFYAPVAKFIFCSDVVGEDHVVLVTHSDPQFFLRRWECPMDGHLATGDCVQVKRQCCIVAT